MAHSHAEGTGALELAPTVCRLCPVAVVRPGDAVSFMVTVPTVRGLQACDSNLPMVLLS